MLDKSIVSEVDRQRLQGISILLANNPNLLRFLFGKSFECLRAPPKDILDESAYLSSGERLLVRIAIDIWSGDGQANLWDIVRTLDEVRFESFMLTLECLRYGRISR